MNLLFANTTLNNKATKQIHVPVTLQASPLEHDTVMLPAEGSQMRKHLSLLSAAKPR
jgi:hypothetical protein